jgi:DNA-binding IclR family transcriptional regulator
VCVPARDRPTRDEKILGAIGTAFISAPSSCVAPPRKQRTKVKGVPNIYVILCKWTRDMKGNEDSPSSTVGTLKCSVFLLRALAQDHCRGRALTELAVAVGLPHPTVHRLLSRLIDEGFIAQHPQSRRYTLGPFLYELGLAAANGDDLGLVYVPVLERVASLTGDTGYVIMRSSLEAVCVARVDGSHPIRPPILDAGSRRPLGVGAGGLAILSACPDDEARWIVEATASEIGRFGHLDVAGQLSAISESRRQGVRCGQHPGPACCYRGRAGLPRSVRRAARFDHRSSAFRKTAGPRSRAEIGKLLRSAVQDIEARLRTMPLRP